MASSILFIETIEMYDIYYFKVMTDEGLYLLPHNRDYLKGMKLYYFIP